MRAPTVRDPEGLTRRLARWCTDRLRAEGVPLDEPVTVELLGSPTSGNSNLTLPFTVSFTAAGTPGHEDLVLRMQVPEHQIFQDADVLREHRVLEALDAVPDVPTPSPRFVEADAKVLGAPFFVMARVPGTVPAGTPSIHVTGWLPQQPPAARRRAWEHALRALAALHRLDWRARAGFLVDGPVGTTLEQRLAHLSRWYEWARAGRSYPTASAALSWLHEHRPSDPGPPVLVWGDARVGNIAFGSDHRVVALLDWELASIGPPEIDVGWWLAMEEFQTAAHGVAPLPGWPDRAETVARYEALTGRRLRSLRWYEVLAAWVLTVTVIRMADIGVAAGRIPPGNHMGEGNLPAQMVARWLDLPVPDLDPAYAARRGLA